MIYLIKKIYRNKSQVICFLLFLTPFFIAYKCSSASLENITSAAAKTTVSADDIKRIIELNGASQKITIETDTAFVAVSIPTMLGVSLTFMEKEIPHRLIERRSYLIKAGTKKFELLQNSDGYTLEILMPGITSKEHLADEYTVIKRTGNWNPVTLQKLEIQSRQQAVSTAIEEGILLEAQYSIENALYGILPSSMKIRWK